MSYVSQERYSAAIMLDAACLRRRFYYAIISSPSRYLPRAMSGGALWRY